MLIQTKITLKVNKSKRNIPCSHETLNLDNSSKKTYLKKIFLSSTLDEILMIPLTFVYDKYIDRPKLSVQKKHFSI